MIGHGEKKPTWIGWNARGHVCFGPAKRRGIITYVSSDLKNVSKISVKLHLKLEIDELIHEARDLELLVEAIVHCPCAGDDKATLRPIPNMRVCENVNGSLVIHQSGGERDELNARQTHGVVG